jgi:S1-C subfamily serine protease
MNWLDWVALAVVALSAIAGLRRGLVAGALSLVGLVGGAIIGARLAPQLLGDGARGIPLLTVGAAAAGGALGQWAGGLVGGWARRSLWLVPPLRWLDSGGGLVFGVATGFVAVWVAGVALLYAPGADELRRTAQASVVVSQLTEAVTPSEVVDALGRIDPFLTIVGPSSGVGEPDASILRDPQVRSARRSVVRIRGVACGLGIEGSGWVAARGLVVTNAHVVAGIPAPLVDTGDGRGRRGRVVAFDAANDVAVVRVPGLSLPALRAGSVVEGAPAAVLGYPGNGPSGARPARVGRTATVPSRDAFGRVRLARELVVFRGEVEGGASGGPVVGADGRVVTTVFARRRGSEDGYGVPNDLVREALTSAGPALDTPCVER